MDESECVAFADNTVQDSLSQFLPPPLHTQALPPMPRPPRVVCDGIRAHRGHPAGARRAVALVSAALVVLPFVPASARAQRERLVLRVDAFGGTGITAPSRTTPNGDVTQRSVQLQAAHRILLDGGNTMLLLGAQYRGVRVTLPTAAGTPSGAPTDLHVAAADLWLLRTLDDRHTLVTVLRPGLYGDLDDAGAQFRTEGALFVDRILSPRTTVGVGLSYGSNFGRVLPIPVVHVVARPRRRLLLDALLPARADLWWMPRKGLDLGLGAGLVGAQYGVAGANRLVASADALWLANATIGPQLRWAPQGGKLQFTADGGATVLRRLRYARGGTELVDLAPGNVLFGRAGVQWLF